MDNHAEQLGHQATTERDEEVEVARKLRDLGHLTSGYLYDSERRALLRLVGDGRANDDLTSNRRYTLTAEGLAWLERQGG